jgi:hypothetical protein
MTDGIELVRPGKGDTALLGL